MQGTPNKEQVLTATQQLYHEEGKEWSFERLNHITLILKYSLKKSLLRIVKCWLGIITPTELYLVGGITFAFSLSISDKHK